jgi:hypothetical protein
MHKHIKRVLSSQFDSTLVYNFENNGINTSRWQGVVTIADNVQNLRSNAAVRSN